MIEAQPSPIAQRIRRASDGSSGARTAARSEQGPSGEPGGIRPSPRRPAQADRRRIRRFAEMAAGRRQAQRRGRGREGLDEGEDDRRRQRSPRSAGAVRDASRRRSRDRPPQDCGGTGVFNERRGISGGGTRRAAAKKTKMAAVRLPPARERKRPNGDGFAPRPMIRIKRGRLRKGGAGGKTQAGETAAARLPAAPIKTRTAQRERLQRRARSPAGDVTTRPPRRRGSWARPIPRERSERKNPPTPKYQFMGTLFLRNSTILLESLYDANNPIHSDTYSIKS